jgi:hypothetical protein
MKVFTWIGLFAGVALLAAAFAHYLGGWVGMEAALRSSEVPPEIVGGLWAGWLFGSFAMFFSGLIVLAEAIRQLRGQPACRWTVGCIALLYAGFGVTAWLVRDFNAHFLAFVGTGASVAMLLVEKQNAGQSDDAPR